MPTQHIASSARHPRGNCCVCLSVLLAATFAASLAHADEHIGQWLNEPALQLRAVSYYQFQHGRSQTHSEFAAQLSLERYAPDRPVSGGLFADIGLSTKTAGSHEQFIGGWLSYKYGRWRFSASAGQHYSSETNGLGIYANRLQFELRPGHKISLGAIGLIDSSSAPAFNLIYKTSVADRVSLTFNIGLGSNRMQDYGASTKLVWNLF